MRWVTRAVSLAVVLMVLAGQGRAATPPPLTDCQRALHVLNRLGFGPAPGDMDRALEMGLSAYIEQQLHPERMADPIVDEKLAGLPTVGMTDQQVFDVFEKPAREARRFVEKQFGKPGEAGEEAAKASEKMLKELVPPARQPQRVLDELTRARILRAVYSEKQLNEVLVDFWMNHFNIFAGKDIDRILLTSFERDVIRPHIWRCFRDLLMATAKSPAMLYYLDNAQSVAEPDHRPGFRPNPDPSAPKPQGGLNENYARELLELHTLGVDGGYTQLDVTELARVLTGWAIAPAEEGGGFLFRAPLHDVCAKTVLGHRVPANGGLAEGEEMIDLLARHSSTAHFLALKLCRRLVADEPPAPLVDRVAARFLSTDGDLRETVRAIVESPEFFDPKFYRAKVKSPFEYVVSAIRAVGGATDGGAPVAQKIGQSGEPLYFCQPPTGYPDVAQAWNNTGAFLSRLNFSLALAANKIPGTEVDLARLLPPPARSDPQRAFREFAQIFFGGDVSPDTRRTVEECVLERDAPNENGAANLKITLLAGTLLGSPEFQRR